ncbi:MAG: hypothetical protein AAF571_09440 [Verrucomicrobiota bacterium]
MKLKLLLMMVSLAALTGCATDLKDEDYIEAMSRQDEEAFQRHMELR